MYAVDPVQFSTIEDIASGPNPRTVYHLVRKDVSLYSGMLFGALAAGIVALGLIAAGQTAALYMGGVLLVTVLIAEGAALAVYTVVEELQRKTLPFLMTLPVSSRDYAAAKILANALLFGIPWAFFQGGVILIVLLGPLPDGLLILILIVAGEIALSMCLILATALLTRSLGWTIGVMICANLFFNGFVFQIFHDETFAAAAQSVQIVWPKKAVTFLLCEIAAMSLLLFVAYWSSTRRKEILS